MTDEEFGRIVNDYLDTVHAVREAGREFTHAEAAVRSNGALLAAAVARQLTDKEVAGLARERIRAAARAQACGEILSRTQQQESDAAAILWAVVRDGVVT